MTVTDKKHQFFGQDGFARRLCCECRARPWGPEDIARFETTTPSEVCAECGRDFCPRCSPQHRAGAIAPAYEKLGAEIGRLVEQKQRAYGDAFGKTGEVMRILYPEGIPPEKLDDALAVIRILDKLFRIATDRDALGESPWRDIAGYALLGVARAERKR